MRKLTLTHHTFQCNFLTTQIERKHYGNKKSTESDKNQECFFHSVSPSKTLSINKIRASFSNSTIYYTIFFFF